MTSSAPRSLDENVAALLGHQPFAWMQTNDVTPSPQHIEVAARRFGASVMRVFGQPPGPFFILLSRVPLRSIQDTRIPGQKPFRSFRRYCAVLLLILVSFFGFFLIEALIDRISSGSPTSGVLLLPVSAAPLALALILVFRGPGPAPQQLISALIREFDGRKKVRIFAYPYRLAHRALYCAVAWELGYELKWAVKRVPWGGDDRDLLLLTFERRDHAYQPGPGPAPYETG